MDFALSDEHKALRDGIVKFAQHELGDVDLQQERDSVFSHEAWLKCGEMGLQGLPVPEEHGGAGLDPLSCAIALEALGYGCRDGGLVFSICAHLLACVVPIWKHSNEAQKQRFLPGLCSGRLIAANAMTEPGTGSDAFSMATRAVPQAEGFCISGTKTFCSNGPIADVALVYALTDAAKGYAGGVTAFIVEKGLPGFRPGQRFEKMGLRTSPIGELVLDDVQVSRDVVLGGVGGGGPIFAESMDWERALLVACHVGTMQRLLEQAVEHARTRKQYGQTIGKFQAVAHKIVDMSVRLEAARLLTYRAASRLGVSRDAGMHASTAKLFTSESLVRSALDTIQILGGSGFMVETGAERALRDSVAGTLYSGTSEIQRNIIARWIGL